jgi:hypothetical protein
MISRKQIQDLMRDAVAAGNHELVQSCTVALSDARMRRGAKSAAKQRCADAIAAQSKRCTCPPSPVPTFTHHDTCRYHPANWNKS